MTLFARGDMYGYRQGGQSRPPLRSFDFLRRGCPITDNPPVSLPLDSPPLHKGAK